MTAAGLTEWFDARPAASSSGVAAVDQAVRDQVQQKGRARAIVEVRLPSGAFVPEGHFATDATVQQQRNDIASVQWQVLSKIVNRGGRVIHKYETVPYLALEVDPTALAEIEAAGFHVSRVLEDALSSPALAQSVPLIGADQAWDRGFDGSGSVVAILDTGVDSTHPFLTGKVVEEACYSSNSTADSATTVCPNGGTEQTGAGAGRNCSVTGCEHGTHVAGIVAGNGAGAGQAFSGVARGASLIAVQVFSKFSSSASCSPSAAPCILAYTSDQIAGLQRVYDLSAQYRIASVNMSLGGGLSSVNCDTDPRKSIIDNLRSAGIATVIASGNDGSTSQISKAACISTAVSVGSTTKSDTVSSFSNVASIMSLFAPGGNAIAFDTGNICSSYPAGMTNPGYGVCSSQGTGNFQYNAGTSMATPHVAGAFAILRQASPTATVTDLLTALQQTGLPITDTRAGGTVTKPRIRVADALSRFIVSPVTLTVSKAGAGSGTVTSSPVGINCGAICSASFGGGSVVTLTATPALGSVFAGWSGGGCSGTATCTVTLSASMTVTATFNTGGIGLTVVRAGLGSGTVTSSPAGIRCGATCSASVAGGTAVTLTATADAGSAFTGWSGGGCSGTGTCTVTLTVATTVTATFDAKGLPGDLRASPIVISAVPFSETRQTRNYTSTADDPIHTCTGGADGHTVWYRVTPATAGLLTAQTSGSSYDTVLSVHLASTLAEVSGGCSDDVNPAADDRTSRVDVNLTANTSYLIEVSSWDTSAGGNLSLSVSFTAQTPQPGDSRTAPIAITATPFTDAARNTRLHTSAADDPVHSCTGKPDGRTIWYSFTPAAWGTATITTAGSTYDTVLSVHLGSNLAEVTGGCSDDVAAGNLTSQVQVSLSPDTLYLIEVSAYGASAGGDLTLALSFAADQQTLNIGKTGTGSGTVKSSPAGIDCGATCSANFPSGSPVTLTATASANSIFTGWSGGGCSGTDPCTVTMNAAVSVAATFALQTYTLTVARAGSGSGTVTSNPAGIDCGAACSLGFASGTQVTLTATPTANSIFTGWSGGGCSGTGTCTVTMNVAASVTATFALQTYTLTVGNAGSGAGTVTGSPTGIDCGATCSTSFTVGTVVTLTATPTANSTFTGWSGACSGTGTCAVTLNAATSVTATFTLRSYTLTVSRLGSADGTVTSSPGGIACGAACSASYVVGTVITLTATPDSTGTLAHWGGGCAGTTTSCSITLAADTQVTASFSRIFADPTISSSTSLVRTVHITDLRAAIDTLRSRFTLRAFGWADLTLTAGVTPIRVVHLTDLRTALSQAYQAAGRSVPVYLVDPTVTARGTLIRARHINDLRDAVRALE